MTMYRYLFGPVPSRRLGMSLGVDLVYHKVCTFDCVYCECGETTELTLERDEYVPVGEVVQELDHYFARNQPLDYVTFSGSGEPLLNSGISTVIAFIKEKKNNVPVAVLTNGALLSREKARADIMGADLVIPSLDAAASRAFRRINRPAAGIDLTGYIEGIAAFSRTFKGELWLEIFILPGYNDSKADMASLKEAVDRIGPARIQLNTLDRPGTVPGIAAAPRETLEAAAAVLGPERTQIIASFKARDTNSAFRQDMETAIMETLSRRPCTVEDLASILGTKPAELNKYLSHLEESGRIETVRQQRGIFYRKVAQ